jgi:hypothetical protein
MSGMSRATFVVFLVLSAALIDSVHAKAFLTAHSDSQQERISEEEIQTSLLAEIEGTFGAGAASSRLKKMEATLAPMYAALPKNEHGNLGHATVRYALHRLFVQRHGWIIKGLDDAGGHRNSTSTAGLLKEQVPAYVQDLFEQRLGGRGFGLHELGVVAATIEHLVHNQVVKHVSEAFKAHGYLLTSIMNTSEADEVLDTYMMGYILGESLDNTSLEEVLEIKAEMPETFASWGATKEFVRTVRKNVTASEGNAEQHSSGTFDFSLIARVAERVGEQFGSFQDHECRHIKASLRSLEDGQSGRVRLSEFWKPSPDGSWHFEESFNYLRQLGALDESDSAHPHVLIANYITSHSNCIASSSFYSVCCKDECEDLLGHLEGQIAAPEATPEEIVWLVSTLSSSSIAAPRRLSTALMSRLDEIAAGHGGKVPLHGRLFSQWMHHAYPQECPYPHVAGTTNPLTPDEWLEATGEDEMVSDDERNAFFEKVALMPSASLEADSLPWSPEEELLCPATLMQPAQGNSTTSYMRNASLFAVLAAMAYGLLHSSLSVQRVHEGVSADKVMV